jgi:hypothetical protein
VEDALRLFDFVLGCDVSWLEAPYIEKDNVISALDITEESETTRTRLWTRYLETVKEMLLTDSLTLTIPFVFKGSALHLEVDKPVDQFPKEASSSDSRLQLTWSRRDVDAREQQLFVGMLIQSAAVAAIFANSPETGTRRNLGTQLIHYSPLGSGNEEPQLESADVFLSSIDNRLMDLQCGIFREQRDKPQWIEQLCTPIWHNQLTGGSQNQLLQCHCSGSRLRMELDLGFGGLFKNDPLHTTTTTTTTCTTTATTTGVMLSTAASTEREPSSSTTTILANFTTTANSDTSTASNSSDSCSFTVNQTPYIFSFTLLTVSFLALIVALIIHKLLLGPR